MKFGSGVPLVAQSPLDFALLPTLLPGNRHKAQGKVKRIFY